MIEDTTNPSFAVGQRGTGHGVWEYQGHHSFTATSVAFINFTNTPPPPPGFTAGTQTIKQTITSTMAPTNGPLTRGLHLPTLTARSTVEPSPRLPRSASNRNHSDHCQNGSGPEPLTRQLRMRRDRKRNPMLAAFSLCMRLSFKAMKSFPSSY
jgi:hypothetical protein